MVENSRYCIHILVSLQLVVRQNSAQSNILPTFLLSSLTLLNQESFLRDAQYKIEHIWAPFMPLSSTWQEITAQS